MQTGTRVPAGPIATLLVAMSALLVALGGQAIHGAPLPIHDDVGGEFSAPSSLGRDVSLSEFRDKVVLLFFGYTTGRVSGNARASSITRA